VNVLDTTVAVDHLRGSKEAVALVRGLVEADVPLVASEVARLELLAGVRTGELEALEAFFTAVSWVPVNEDVARTAGSLARTYRSAHGGIGDADYLIAATALVLDAELLTTNVRHFPMFERLEPPY
jgi:predicted nucleic acid-binding protein